MATKPSIALAGLRDKRGDAHLLREILGEV